MTIDKKQLKIAKNYANALFKIGQEQNLSNELFEQLGEIIEIINISNDLKQFLENPLVSINDKKYVISEIFGKKYNPQIINLLNILADNKRLNLVETIHYCYKDIYEKTNGIIRVRVISAAEVNNENKKRLTEILEKKSGYKIIPQYEIKNDILGGLIIEINDKIIDLSLDSKIKKMEKQLI